MADAELELLKENHNRYPDDCARAWATTLWELKSGSRHEPFACDLCDNKEVDFEKFKKLYADVAQGGIHDAKEKVLADRCNVCEVVWAERDGPCDCGYYAPKTSPDGYYSSYKDYLTVEDKRPSRVILVLWRDGELGRELFFSPDSKNGQLHFIFKDITEGDPAAVLSATVNRGVWRKETSRENFAELLDNSPVLLLHTKTQVVLAFFVNIPKNKQQFLELVKRYYKPVPISVPQKREAFSSTAVEVYDQNIFADVVRNRLQETSSDAKAKNSVLPVVPVPASDGDEKTNEERAAVASPHDVPTVFHKNLEAAINALPDPAAKQNELNNRPDIFPPEASPEFLERLVSNKGVMKELGVPFSLQGAVKDAAAKTLEGAKNRNNSPRAVSGKDMHGVQFVRGLLADIEKMRAALQKEKKPDAYRFPPPMDKDGFRFDEKQRVAEEKHLQESRRKMGEMIAEVFTQAEKVLKGALQRLEQQDKSPLSDTEYQLLISRCVTAMQAATDRVPVYADREPLLAALKKHKVLLISAPTGAGKTTIIPQLLCDDIFSRQKRICVLVPTREMARSMHRKLAQAAPPLGRKDIGYRCGLGTVKLDPFSRIIFTTHGFLAQSDNPITEISKYGAIVIDEAHARSKESDVVLVILKAILQEVQKLNPEFKLIVMSATMEKDKIRKYFGDQAEEFALCTGYAPPVAFQYLDEPILLGSRLTDEATKKNDKAKEKSDNTSEDGNTGRSAKEEQAGKDAAAKKGDKKSGDASTAKCVSCGQQTEPNSNQCVRCPSRDRAKLVFEKAISVAHALLQKVLQLKISPGNILVFMPSVEGVREAQGTLERSLTSAERKRVTVAALYSDVDEVVRERIVGFRSSTEKEEAGESEHSNEKKHTNGKEGKGAKEAMQNEEKKDGEKVASKEDTSKPSGAEVLVLFTTNVAEAGLTIPGVRYVIDTCLENVERLDASGRRITTLVLQSRSSAEQRAGRTGRDRKAPGRCIRLLTEEEYKQLVPSKPPALGTVSLEGLVLQLMSLIAKEKKNDPNGKVFENVLTDWLDKPDPERVQQALDHLKGLNAIESASPTSALTRDGEDMLALPVDENGRIRRFLQLVKSKERARLSQTKDAQRSGVIKSAALIACLLSAAGSAPLLRETPTSNGSSDHLAIRDMYKRAVAGRSAKSGDDGTDAAAKFHPRRLYVAQKLMEILASRGLNFADGAEHDDIIREALLESHTDQLAVVYSNTNSQLEARPLRTFSCGHFMQPLARVCSICHKGGKKDTPAGAEDTEKGNVATPGKSDSALKGDGAKADAKDASPQKKEKADESGQTQAGEGKPAQNSPAETKSNKRNEKDDKSPAALARVPLVVVHRDSVLAAKGHNELNDLPRLIVYNRQVVLPNRGERPMTALVCVTDVTDLKSVPGFARQALKDAKEQAEKEKTAKEMESRAVNGGGLFSGVPAAGHGGGKGRGHPGGPSGGAGMMRGNVGGAGGAGGGMPQMPMGGVQQQQVVPMQQPAPQPQQPKPDFLDKANKFLGVAGNAVGVIGQVKGLFT